MAQVSGLNHPDHTHLSQEIPGHVQQVVEVLGLAGALGPAVGGARLAALGELLEEERDDVVQDGAAACAHHRICKQFRYKKKIDGLIYLNRVCSLTTVNAFC